MAQAAMLLQLDWKLAAGLALSGLFASVLWFQLLRRLQNSGEDPYWFVILGYFGIVGLFLYWVILWKLYQASRWLIRMATSPSERSLGVMFCAITALSFFYSFSERLFKLRPFSFYFWLLAGLVISMCYRQSRLIREQRSQE